MSTRALPRGASAAWAAVGVLTILALILRATQMDQSLAGDEVLAFNEIHRHSLGQALHLLHAGVESSPPLFFVLAWLSVKLGDPTVWIRLPSVILGAATVPVVYALGRRTVSRACGLVGAAVMACAPFAVYYGIEARPYATMTFFLALSTLALVRAVRGGSRWWWAGYAVAAAAAAYSHYTCVFVLGAQAVWSLWACRERIREPLLAAAGIVVLYAPWLPDLQGKDLSVYRQLYPLGFHRVLTDLLRPLPGHPSAPLRAIPTRPGLAVVGACALGGLVALGRRLATRAEPAARRSHLVLLVALTLATPVGVLAYSLLGTDIWLPRNLISSLPAAALLLGALVTALPRPAGLAVSAAVLAVLLFGSLRSFEPAYTRGPYRQIAAYLDRVAPAGDPVTIVSLVGGPAIPVHFHHRHHLVGSTAKWRSGPGVGRAYLVLDETIARAWHIGVPRAPGFRYLERRRWGGNLPTDVLIYAPAGG